MRGRLAHAAQIARRRGEPATEVMLPEPVCNHPRNEEIVFPRQPLREHDARLGRLCRGAIRRARMQRLLALDRDPRNRRFDPRSRPTKIAADTKIAWHLLRVSRLVQHASELVLIEVQSRFEEGSQAVEIRLADRIELVTVALGAADRPRRRSPP